MLAALVRERTVTGFLMATMEPRPGAGAKRYGRRIIVKLSMRDKIQVVFFDASGTLFDVRGSVGEIYCQFARQYGISADPASIQQQFLQAFRNQPPLAFPPETPVKVLHRLEFEWWSRLARAVFAEFEFPLFDQFFADIFEY